MKKIILLLIAISLVSCSNDDNSSPDENSIPAQKPSRIVTLGLSSIGFNNIEYENNKILRENYYYGAFTQYTYTGNLITKLQKFDSDKSIQFTIEYSYTNGKLASSVKWMGKDDTEYYKIKYVHNNDNTVTFQEFYRNPIKGVEEKTALSGTLTYKSGNLVKSEVKNFDTFSVYNYEYDTKNSPLKNVVGFNLLLDREHDLSVNNVIKISGIVTKTTGNKETSYYLSTYTYDYDENDFPTERKNFDGTGASAGGAIFNY